jgi:hypothetical protein
VGYREIPANALPIVATNGGAFRLAAGSVRTLLRPAWTQLSSCFDYQCGVCGVSILTKLVIRAMLAAIGSLQGLEEAGAPARPGPFRTGRRVAHDRKIFPQKKPRLVAGRKRFSASEEPLQPCNESLSEMDPVHP